MAGLKWYPAVGLALLIGCASIKRPIVSAPSTWALATTPLDRSAARLENDTYEHLAWAKAYRARILEVDGSRTIANTLDPYNNMLMHLTAARDECRLFAQVHPNKAVRRVAGSGDKLISQYLMQVHLDRNLYEALRSLDVSQEDGVTQYLMFKVLRAFRRAGVDKSEETRERIAVLHEEIGDIKRKIQENLRNDEREVVFESLADLDGLPEDWIAQHPPADDGAYHVNTHDVDYFPVMTYARNPETRRKVYQEFKKHGYPQNVPLLHQLLMKRHELAQLLDYSNWAAYITADKMIETAVNAQSFIDKMLEVSRVPADRDYALLLEQKRKDFPEATQVDDWDINYYERLVRTENFAFDPQSVKVYFNFPDVLNGLFHLTEEMFGVSYRPVHGLKLWHDDVTAWNVYDGRNLLGRFYLDLHPRAGKSDSVGFFNLRTGIEGKRLPQVVLVAHFPNPLDNPKGVALMEHHEVVILFHEFAHVLHAIFAGHQRWMGNAGLATEWDFVEAPSQMMEEWCYNFQALRSFARHYQTGDPIPAALVEKLQRTADFGKGLKAAQKLFYAWVSLNFYNRNPKDLDTTKLMVQMQNKYSPLVNMNGRHFQCSLGHLDGYAAIHYADIWSQMIARDLFSRFEKEGILNTKTASQYRHLVLEPGGSRKAADLILDFLHRPYSFDVYEAWLNRDGS